jgi:hypothetical protein
VRSSSSSQYEPEPIVARDFGPASVNKVVNDILHRIQDSLLVSKDPEKRLQLIVQGILEHSDIRTIRETLGQDQWGLTKKAMQARDGIFQRLAAAIHERKDHEGEWLKPGYHVGIQYYEREPPDSEHNFQRSTDVDEIIVCCEGVIYASNDLKLRPLGRRSARRSTQLNYSRETSLLTLDDPQVVVNNEESRTQLPLFF